MCGLCVSGLRITRICCHVPPMSSFFDMLIIKTWVPYARILKHEFLPRNTKTQFLTHTTYTAPPTGQLCIGK